MAKKIFWFLLGMGIGWGLLGLMKVIWLNILFPITQVK